MVISDDALSVVDAMTGGRAGFFGGIGFVMS